MEIKEETGSLQIIFEPSDHDQQEVLSNDEIEVKEKSRYESLTKLDPSSSGRQRYRPKKFD